MDTTRIIDAIKTDQIKTARQAQDARCRLAAAVRRGLRAEARLVAAQVAAYGPKHAAELAAHRGRDRRQAIKAVLVEVAEVQS